MDTLPEWQEYLQVSCPTCKAAVNKGCDAPRKQGIPHVTRQDKWVRKYG